MGLFKLFAGKSPDDHERSGDALVRDQVWGDAKLAYEAALDKLAKQPQPDPVMFDRLRDKLLHSKEALALYQRRHAKELVEAGCADEARELFALAIELTADPRLKEEIALEAKQTVVRDRPVFHAPPAPFHTPPDVPAGDAIEDDADHYFNVLLGALPDEVQQAYQGYGHHFKQGYLALNQGAFDQAVEHLRQAAEENPSPQSLVPLELATAYVNLGQAAAARVVLEELVRHRPDLLPALQLLCEIYWEEKNFDEAMQLLDALAPELAQSMGAYLLRGETLLQAARNEEAKSFFQELFQSYGWNDTVALGLARACEGLGQTIAARDVYGELITQCSGCGTRIDPSIKRKYADLSLAAGDHSAKVLEYYLALCRDDPANAPQYCRNISRIYAALGNDAEAERFQSIAEDLAQSERLPG